MLLSWLIQSKHDNNYNNTSIITIEYSVVLCCVLHNVNCDLLSSSRRKLTDDMVIVSPYSYKYIFSSHLTLAPHSSHSVAPFFTSIPPPSFSLFYVPTHFSKIRSLKTCKLHDHEIKLQLQIVSVKINGYVE